MADGAVQGRVRSTQDCTQRQILSVVSFFSGCGGLDLGFLGGFSFLGDFFPKNRFKIVGAYDADAEAIQAYRANIGLHAHVEDLSCHEMGKFPHADVLLGGFPCQEFSQCGPRRGLDSERGQLYRSMVEYASVHRPLLIVGENVAGLMYRDQGRALAKICSDFEQIGYTPNIWEFHAEDYGVPQARHRIFLIFVRSDIDSGSLEKPPRSSCRITAKMALQDLLSPAMRKTPNQDQFFRAKKAGRGHGQGDERTPADGPGYTVRANAKSRVQFHYSRPRRLTVRESARLQSFPDTFNFPFAATSNMRLIGNAVPPVLAHQVAKALQSYLIGEGFLQEEVFSDGA